MALRQLVTHFDHIFRGQFPDVPTNENVSQEEILQIDPDPVFITLPFAKRDAVASDGFKYTQAFNARLESQIKTDGITGYLGHATNKGFFDGGELPLPVIHWVGSMEDGNGTAWAKGLVVDPSLKQQVKLMKATGSKIGTSIIAAFDPSTIIYHDDGSWEIDPNTVDFHHLDMVPPKMAALEMERPFDITAHSKKIENEENEEKEIKVMELNDIPQELMTQITSPLDEKAKILQSKVAELENELLSSRLEKIIRKSLTIQSTSLYNYVYAKLELAIHTKSNINLEETLEEIMSSEDYKEIAEAVVQSKSGGSLKLNPETIHTDNNEKREALLDQTDEIMQTWGVK